eukprot:scaffold36253_cov79-Isochrysis_galbana.AAC.1
MRKGRCAPVHHEFNLAIRDRANPLRPIDQNRQLGAAVANGGQRGDRVVVARHRLGLVEPLPRRPLVPAPHQQLPSVSVGQKLAPRRDGRSREARDDLLAGEEAARLGAAADGRVVAAGEGCNPAATALAEARCRVGYLLLARQIVTRVTGAVGVAADRATPRHAALPRV